MVASARSLRHQHDQTEVSWPTSFSFRPYCHHQTCTRCWRLVLAAHRPDGRLCAVQGGLPSVLVAGGPGQEGVDRKAAHSGAADRRRDGARDRQGAVPGGVADGAHHPSALPRLPVAVGGVRRGRMERGAGSARRACFPGGGRNRKRAGGAAGELRHRLGGRRQGRPRRLEHWSLAEWAGWSRCWTGRWAT